MTAGINGKGTTERCGGEFDADRAARRLQELAEEESEEDEEDD